VTGRWGGITGVPNGGYLLAMCTRALGLRLPFPDPIVVSGFFLRPGTPGPATIRTSVVREGRTTAFGEAVLSQSGKDVIRAAAAFARLGGSGGSRGPGSGGSVGPGSVGPGSVGPGSVGPGSVGPGSGGPGFGGGPGSGGGPVLVDGAPPDLPPPSDCVGVPVGSFGPATIAERVEFRSREVPGWFLGRPTGRPSSEFWMRFADGRDADLLALLVLVDSTAPSVLELGAGSATIQLTVHLRAHPAPGWLATRATTRFVSGGYHEEDFEVWDSAGALVAQSRQLAIVQAL
jgi:acyl-Coa thioesterase superfamily protein/acyl-CoA thioesterase superfamily protein